MMSLQDWPGRLVDSQRGHLFVWLPVAFGLGAGLYFALRWEPGQGEYAIAAGTAFVAVLLGWRLANWVAPPICGIAFICLGFIWAGVQAHHAVAPVLKFRYYGPIEGRIVAIDRSVSGKVRLTLDKVVLDRVEPHRRPARLRVSLHGDQPYLTPEPGMVVMMTGHLSPPSGPVEPGGFDFQRKAWFDQLGAIGYTRTPALVLEPAQAKGFKLRLYTLRRNLAAGLKVRIGGTEGPFAAAILTGDRADLDEIAVEALRASNLAHLLAISGLHMGLLTGVIFALVRVGLALIPGVAMRSEPKKVAAILALIVALAYLGISGANVATQRAFAMVAVMLLAVFLGRRALTLRSVAVAALIVLIIAPDSLTGPGFQMSFAATTALVAVFAWARETQIMQHAPGWTRPVLTLVISSGVAGLATAPFGAAHFNQVAQYGLIANLASVPVMGLVVMPGAVLAGFLYPLGLEQIGLEIMRLGLAWILFVAETVAGQGGSLRLISAPGAPVLPMIAIGGLVLCLWQGRGRLVGFAVIAAAFVIWANTDRPPLLIAETGRLIGLNSADGRILNKPRGDGFTARSWLENDGDPVDQAQAAARGLVEANYAQFQLQGADIIFDAAKDLTQTDIEELCKTADLVIAPQYSGAIACLGLSGDDFKKGGSMAVHVRNGVPVVSSSRARRGPRLWVR